MNFSTVSMLKSLSRNTPGYSSLEGEQLKKFQKYLLNIAKDIIDTCELEGLSYVLSGGTALGAVRTGGFIPWDDDMDINILGDDYDRFCECFLAKYGDKYEIHDSKTPGYCKPMARVCLKGSRYRDYDEEGVNDGFFVDLFRIENYPDNVLIRTIHGVMCTWLGFCLSCRVFFACRKSRLRIAKANPKVAKVFYFKIFVGALLSFLTTDAWVKLTWKCYALCKNGHSKYVGLPAGRKHYFGELYLRQGMVDSVMMPFEGYQWRVSKDYDTYFRVLYGSDYMTPPPENEREHHVYFELKFPDED